MKLAREKWHGCPMRYSAETIADKWTFLILRDLMFRGKDSYNSFLKSSENISTNILANRLLKLEEHGLLTKARDAENGKKYVYSLTDKGWDLVPVMLKLFEWSIKYDENTWLTEEFVERIKMRPDVVCKEFRSGKVLALETNHGLGPRLTRK